MLEEVVVGEGAEHTPDSRNWWDTVVAVAAADAKTLEAAEEAEAVDRTFQTKHTRFLTSNMDRFNVVSEWDEPTKTA